ncbi:hypothetical protein LTR28_007259 [Elasticomyces elasticus]|nr:hypothetical protein LTR28_007259 [Elasticomyces elasticus]
MAGPDVDKYRRLPLTALPTPPLGRQETRDPLSPRNSSSSSSSSTAPDNSQQQEGLLGRTPTPSHTSPSADGGPWHLHDDPAGRGSEDSEDPERVSLWKGTEQTSTHEAGEDANERYQASRSPSAFSITMAVSVLILITDIVATAPIAPRMVIFEDIICRNHYAAWRDSAGLGDCKIEPVQSELARIGGWKETFDTIPER